MQSKLSWPVLIVSGLLWLLGLWVALFPQHVRSFWLRLFRTDAGLMSPLSLRLIGALWFVLLGLVLWFNSRSHS
jgi:hypothetical protein